MSSDHCTQPKQPCKTCPWRKDQTAADIPNFDLALAERLSRTSPDERGMGPDWNAPQFACHQSGIGKEIVCQGWLAMVGHAHPMVRLGVLQGRVDPEALAPGADWPDLHPTYPDVLAKLRLTSEPPETNGTTDKEKRCP
jgi:hypothetical protein